MWTTVPVAAIPFDGGGAPIERGFLPLRSHADAFLSRTQDPDTYRAAFDERYRRQAGSPSERLRAVESALAGDGSGLPFVLEWAEAVRRCQRAAHPLLVSARCR
ncbi:lantibiotic dehydratase C-terminal domain-containing protein [Streptomyces piniterrae]|uniref:lantibiotic dehydratase C-terminal domain-containing protein n=1 Tax=Streptomyces piniterrae TaxID=2571125 RepID=UPI002482E413|nr:lantibiotic dehydratase C-terminal domain-containing protein [Streptomyces piniterrae]